MANKGWPSQQGGSGQSANARQSGRVSGTGNAESFIKGSRIADHGPKDDPMDGPGDLAEARENQLGQ